MNVIVKGMKMPKNCALCERWSICECLKEYNDYESILYAVDDGDLVRADHCPLVEIPTPHGRLIDADKIEYENWYLEETGESYKMVGKDDIDGMPTIIEAEGSET